MLPRAATLALLLALGVVASPARAQAPAEAEADTDPARASAQAAPRAVSAVVSPDQVRLGESFTLTIEVRDSSEVRYELPPDLSLGKEFDLVRITPTRATKDGETVTRFVIEALLFELGEKPLGSLVLSAAGPQGLRRLTIQAPTVTGTGVLPEDQEAELHDILPPVEVLVPRYTALWIIAGTILATLTLLLLWRWLKGRPKRVPVAPIVPRAPAHERALARLEELQREDLPGQGRAKEFHFLLSEILRDYLGERFGFLALDMTTEELLATLTRTATPGLVYSRFEAWCSEGDLVKYAKLQPTPASCKQAIEDAFGFVRDTVPASAARGAVRQGRSHTGAAAP
ncbi:MAG: hypothetical protein HY901_29460 [Deltaproteobacteria bacterium]|nr:hypothetical protein [Deltaproteobacteria bacterium]